MSEKKEKKLKEGKIFESCIASSCPSHIWVKKLADNASSWSNGTKSIFATSNECDYIMHDENSGILYGLELKSTKEKHFTFWREDFEKECKERGKQTHYMIGKKQIKGLEKWSDNHKGVFGFILNFRNEDNDTFFVSIIDFLNYTNQLEKPRFQLEDVIAMKAIRIGSKKLKTNYRYDMENFFLQMTEVKE